LIRAYVDGLFQIAFNSSDWLLSSNNHDIELPKGEEYYWNVGIEKLENIEIDVNGFYYTSDLSSSSTNRLSSGFLIKNF
jgi:hypothetical protein